MKSFLCGMLGAGLDRGGILTGQMREIAAPRYQMHSASSPLPFDVCLDSRTGRTWRYWLDTNAHTRRHERSLTYNNPPDGRKRRSRRSWTCARVQPVPRHGRHIRRRRLRRLLVRRYSGADQCGAFSTPCI